MSALSPFQRQRIIERLSDGLTARSAATMHDTLSDDYLCQIWAECYPGEPLPPNDVIRYAELVAKLRQTAIAPIWAEIEAIKQQAA